MTFLHKPSLRLMFGFGVAAIVLVVAIFMVKPIIFPAEDMSSIQTYIRKQYKNGESLILIPPGEYRVDEAIHISDVNNLVIDAQGSTLVFTNHLIGFRIMNSSHVTLKNLTITYDPLPYTQGVVTKVHGDGEEFEIKIDDGYFISDELLNYFRTAGLDMFSVDPAHRAFKAGSPDFLGTHDIERISEQSLRIRFDYKTNFHGTIVPGDTVVVKARGHHALYLVNVSDSTVENVTILSSAQMGIVERDGDGGNRYDNIRIMPGPKPKGAQRERLLSANHDGFHSSSMVRGPIIENCFFELTGDDGINIHGPMAFIIDTDSTTNTAVITLRNKNTNISPGDTIQIIDGKTSVVTSTATIQSVKRLVSSHLLTRAHDYWRLVYGDADPQLYELQLSSADPFPTIGDVVAILNRSGQGAVIRDCTIRGNRARGMLVRSPHTSIEGNTLERISMAGIVIAPELYWMEGPIPHSVSITGNTLTHMGLSWNPNLAPHPFLGNAIFVGVMKHSGISSVSQDIRDLIIRGNAIHDSVVDDIVIYNTSQVTIDENEFD